MIKLYEQVQELALRERRWKDPITQSQTQFGSLGRSIRPHKYLTSRTGYCDACVPCHRRGGPAFLSRCGKRSWRRLRGRGRGNRGRGARLRFSRGFLLDRLLRIEYRRFACRIEALTFLGFLLGLWAIGRSC
jgi:hypothetical protein